MYSIQNTSFIGKAFYVFDTLPSTNNFALELLSKSKPSDGTVIMTHNQTAGRGQIGNHWYSEPDKNITLSVILFPLFLNIQQQFFLNEAIALAAYDTISEYIDSNIIRIKWSNDVLINDQKVCGMLIQNSIQGNQFQYTVVGIGINVNQTNFADTDTKHATSMRLHYNNDFSLQLLIENLCRHIEYYYQRLQQREFTYLHELYMQRLYRKGQRALYQRTADASYFYGTISDVLPYGGLVIATDNGTEVFDTKQLVFV